MNIEIIGVGGYNEVGKNMTAIKVGNETVILDMGYYLQKLSEYEEQGGNRMHCGAKTLIKAEAIPDDRIIEDLKKEVKAIIPSHCHLDHIGAIPYLANKYNAPVIGTPYTVEVLKQGIKNDGFNVKNEIKELETGKKIKVGKKIEVELIHMTHSTPHTAMIALHTPKGTILYANDFKLDNSPVLGKKPDYKRIKQLGQDNVLAIVIDALYCGKACKTPSEAVARELVKDVILGVEHTNKKILGTCFASHLGRLKSLVDYGKKIDRKVMFIGRSLLKYIEAAKKVGIIDLGKEAEIIGYQVKARRKLKQIKNKLNEYMIIATGGQGEPNSALTKMVTGEIPINFESEDTIIFSNKVIPVEPNIGNRRKLENNLKKKGARVFTDVHVSGHGGKEDIRELLHMVNPQYIIPSHGDNVITAPMKELMPSMGFDKNQLKYLKNGKSFKLKI